MSITTVANPRTLGPPRKPQPDQPPPTTNRTLAINPQPIDNRPSIWATTRSARSGARPSQRSRVRLGASVAVTCAFVIVDVGSPLVPPRGTSGQRRPAETPPLPLDESPDQMAALAIGRPRAAAGDQNGFAMRSRDAFRGVADSSRRDARQRRRAARRWLRRTLDGLVAR
jgi:hypothetical protein